jgi:DNA-binding GntR family transcriptional regulator
MVPESGAYVPPPSGRQIHDLMELRTLREQHAAPHTPSGPAVTSARVGAVQRWYYWFIRPAREGSAGEPLR